MGRNIILIPARDSLTLITFTLLTEPAQLDDLRPEWLDLLSRSGTNEAMLTPMWLLPWWRVYGDAARRLTVIAIRRGERLVGLAPLLRRVAWHRGLLPLRRLEPLGTGEPIAERVWSDYPTVIAERGAEDEVCRMVAGARLGGWDEVVFPGMDATQASPLALAFRRRGCPVEIEPAGAAPYLPLPPTWEAYLASLSSSRRYYLTRSLRDFDRWAGGEVRVCRADSPASLAEGRAVLFSLHAERWGAAGQGSLFDAPRFRTFHEAAMAEFFAHDALELLWLRARGQPVAVLYSLVWGGKVSFYQAGRRVDLPGNVRPGVVLHAHAIQAAIEAGRREYDFLAGVSRYKEQFALATRPLVDLRVARPGVAEALRGAVEGGVARLRPLRAWWRGAADNMTE